TAAGRGYCDIISPATGLLEGRRCLPREHFSVEGPFIGHISLIGGGGQCKRLPFTGRRCGQGQVKNARDVNYFGCRCKYTSGHRIHYFNAVLDIVVGRADCQYSSTGNEKAIPIPSVRVRPRGRGGEENLIGAGIALGKVCDYVVVDIDSEGCVEVTERSLGHDE